MDAERHPTLADVDKAIIGEIWTANTVYDNLAVLCEAAEHRFAGSPEVQHASDFLLDLMRHYGLQKVHVEGFEFNGWQRGSVRLRMLSPGQQELDCLALPGSPSGVIEGEVLSLGHGTPGDYTSLADRIAGRIVTVTNTSPAYLRRRMHRVEKYFRAVEAGAAAFIWVREEGGHLIETGSLSWGETAPVPAIAVSREVGHALRQRRNGEPPRIRIEIENSIAPSPAWNLVGEIPGQWEDERSIVVGSHYDTHDISPGAMDNGAGTLVMLEAARVLARHSDTIGRTIRFVCFTGEEVGLIGSQQYVDTHRDELDTIGVVFNLDGAGRQSEPGIAVQGWPELILPLRRIFEEMNDPVPVDNHVGLYSDMYPFVAEGVPSVALFPFGNKPVRGWSHTTADTMDKVSIRYLRRDAILAARFLLRLTNTEEWPAERKSPAQVQAIFEEAGLREVLEIERRWPFDS